MDLNDSNVILTGATGGIGRLLALGLADAGANLVLTGRRQTALDDLANELSEKTRVVTVSADLSLAGGREKVMQTALEQLGSIDLAVLNAGGMILDAFEKSPSDSVESLININLTAPMLMSQALVSTMKARGQGRIAIMGSILGSIGMPYYAAYCASKAGLQRFAESLRRELDGSGVEISYLAPRATDTAFNDANARAMQKATGTAVDSPDWVADAVLRSIQADKAEAYFGWPERFFVKLNALLPRLVDGALMKQARKMREFLPT
ncbi:MAG: SDR family oxidoreductase [Gammaproteobacteria bacterium]